jgi:rubredoxin
MAQDRRCPDCDVTMGVVEFGMSDAWNPHVRTGDSRDGILGSLGMNETRDVASLLCPECGLLRLYALPNE